jgi:hypothetical protein
MASTSTLLHEECCLDPMAREVLKLALPVEWLTSC